MLKCKLIFFNSCSIVLIVTKYCVQLKKKINVVLFSNLRVENSQYCAAVFLVIVLIFENYSC